MECDRSRTIDTGDSKDFAGYEDLAWRSEVSYNAREVLEKYPMAEGIMRGEGEETFAELVAYYEGRGAAELINIQGITFREKEKQIAATPFRQIMDLSKVPFVYGDIENFKNRIIYYETSRGCPFSCSYCLSSIDKCLRFRNLELVEEKNCSSLLIMKCHRLSLLTEHLTVSMIMRWQSGIISKSMIKGLQIFILKWQQIF